MLKRKIERIKEYIYMANDNVRFEKRCKLYLLLSSDISNFCKDSNIKIETYPDEEEPSQEWLFEFEGYTEGNFSVKYSAKLIISKLENIYSLNYFAEVPNNDPKRIDPNFLLDSDDVFCIAQYNFDELVVEKLKNFDRLYIADSFREVRNLSFKEDITIFGNAVTYYDLAFRGLINEIKILE
jgi:hypothetical protein